MDEKTKKKSVEKRGTRKKKDLVINSLGVETSEPKKKATKKEKVTTTKKARQQKGQPAPTFEQVQLRAYFISEQRRSFGLPGNENSDWVRAEEELREELLVERGKVI